MQAGVTNVGGQGVAGIFLGASKGQERIYARSRLGYIRLAMDAGAGHLRLLVNCDTSSTSLPALLELRVYCINRMCHV